MKAACLVGAQSFQVRELEDPAAPPDGLLLRVHSCGVCGSDLRRWKEGNTGSAAYVVPGHEFSGDVIAVGPQVKDYKVGERLAVAPDVHCGKCFYCRRGLYNLCDDLHFLGITPGYPGGFAGLAALNGEVLSNGCVHPMPEGMSYDEAALAEPCSSVLACHAQCGTALGDTVLVMGGGPIGCLHIAVAKARGARVILSEPAVLRRSMAAGFNPDRIVDPQSEDLAAVVRQVSGGPGADLVICANPVAATQTQAVEVVRKGGRVVLFGGLPKAGPMTTLDANRIHYGEIIVAGSFSYHPSFHAQALDVISHKLIPSDKLMTHTFPLEMIDEAFNTAAGGEALKVIIRLQEV